MDQTSFANNNNEASAVNIAVSNNTEQPAKLSNVVLQRLIEEVKCENQNNISSYNRTHNRHNRGR